MVTDQNGDAFPGNVSWASNAPGVFTVNSSGRATAVANGSGVVTASLQGLSASAPVTVEQVPSSVVATSGNQQRGRGGRPLSRQLVVVVRDAGNAPVVGVQVVFATTEGNGVANPGSAVTEADGQAAAYWTLGEKLGPQSMTASIDRGPRVSFTATALTPEELVESISVIAGENQQGRVLRAVGKPIVVRVLDESGAAVEGASVIFSPAEGHGTAAPDSAVSNESGLVSTTWTLGAKRGSQLLTASVPGRASVRLTATAVTPEELADSIAVISGSGQAALVGARLHQMIVVRVLDEHGVPIEGAAVTFRTGKGHGEAMPDSTVTEAIGKASTIWTLGANRGSQLLTVGVPGRDSVQVSATALYAAALERISGNRQSALAGEELEAPIVVQVLDQTGARLEGATVRFVPTTGQGAASPDSAVSDANGEAATIWMLGDSTGVQRLLATVHDSTKVQFEARSKSGLGVCDRTPQIRDAIMARLGGTECANIGARNLVRVRRLDLDDVPTITSLYADDLAGLTHLETLLLRFHEFDELPGDIFQGLEKLGSLYLSGNRLSRLPAGVLSDLTALRLLSLRGNELHSLPAGTFAGLDSLVEISLRDNRFERIDPALAGLPNLQTLYLDSNPLADVTREAFAGLHALRRLTLGNTRGNPRLHRLPADLFSGLHRLEVLGITGTGLSELPSGIFSGLTELRGLDLQQNYDLRHLPEDVFAGLSSLEYVWMHTSVSDLPARLLAGLTSLESLSLSGSFSSVPKGFFADQTALVGLSLQGSELSEVPEALLDLTNLQGLRLANFVPKDLPPRSLSALTALETLTLSGARGKPLLDLSDGAFDGLSSLKELRTDGYTLLLSRGSFAGLTNLQLLNLGRSGIADLPEGVFSSVPNLRILGLFGNELGRLPHFVFSGLHQLERLELSSNPGTPFPIELSMERRDTTDLTAPGPATVVVKVREGAPFDITIPLAASGGAVSVGAATIATGQTQSAPITVTAGGPGVVTIRFDGVPAVPDSDCRLKCYGGIFIAPGRPLTLFR